MEIYPRIVNVQRECPQPNYHKTLGQYDEAGKICITTLTDDTNRATIQKYNGWRDVGGILDI